MNDIRVCLCRKLFFSANGAHSDQRATLATKCFWGQEFVWTREWVENSDFKDLEWESWQKRFFTTLTMMVPSAPPLPSLPSPANPWLAHKLMTASAGGFPSLLALQLGREGGGGEEDLFRDSQSRPGALTCVDRTSASRFSKHEHLQAGSRTSGSHLSPHPLKRKDLQLLTYQPHLPYRARKFSYPCPRVKSKSFGG